MKNLEKATYQNQRGTTTATYTNLKINDTFIMGGITDLEMAKRYATIVCDRAGWSRDIISENLSIELN